MTGILKRRKFGHKDTQKENNVKMQVREQHMMAQRCRKEVQVMMMTETGVMHLQAKEHQRLLSTTRS